ncbi:putative ribonuclease H-like domain-containing protein, partial [Tanacetum coccineum]
VSPGKFSSTSLSSLVSSFSIRDKWTAATFSVPFLSLISMSNSCKSCKDLFNKGLTSFIENQLNKKVKAIRCDNGTEFKNSKLIELYGSKGIKRDYSNARTPQQNGVAERKNRTLIEAARTMLADSKLPTMFWTEAVIPNVSHLKPFGCHVTILNTSDHLGKFEGKADEGFLVGYSAHSTQDDSDSESDEQFIIVPSFPSNQFSGREVNLASDTMESTSDYAEELARLQRQEYEENMAAGGSDVPSTPSSSMVEPIYADATPLPLGHSLGSSENSTRFPSPSDLANHTSSSSEMEGIHHHPTTAIFSESSYDADFGGSITNLAPHIDVDPVPTRILLGDLSLHLFRLELCKREMQQFDQEGMAALSLYQWKNAIGIYGILKNKKRMQGVIVAYLVKQERWDLYSQDKYVQDMLKKFDMESVRLATTPFEASKPKSRDEPDDAVNVHLYRSMIGSKADFMAVQKQTIGLLLPLIAGVF